MQPENRSREQEQDMAFSFFMRRSTPRLSSNPGTNRFRWDLKHEGAWDANPGRSYRNGPTAAPGEYKVRLTIDDQVFTQSFYLLPDPRLEGVTIEDMKAQEKLSLQVRDLLSESKQLADQISQRRENLAKLIEQQKNDRLQKEDGELNMLENQLITEHGAYMTPMLIDQISYLAAMLDQADQMPGKDAYARFDELRQRLDKIQASFKKTTE